MKKSNFHTALNANMGVVTEGCVSVYVCVRVREKVGECQIRFISGRTDTDTG